MCNRIYQFIHYNLVSDNNIALSALLINLPENIRKDLGKGNIGCGIFVDLQKAFDTVKHEILLAKLEHQGIRGFENNTGLRSFKGQACDS